MMIGIFKEWLVKYFFVHQIVLKAIRHLAVHVVSALKKTSKVNTILKVVIFKHSAILFRCSMICRWPEPNRTCVSAELQHGPIRHNGAKKNLQLKHKNSLFTLQAFHYNYY
jgi:hypothetical protein